MIQTSISNWLLKDKLEFCLLPSLEWIVRVIIFFQDDLLFIPLFEFLGLLLVYTGANTKNISFKIGVIILFHTFYLEKLSSQ